MGATMTFLEDRSGGQCELCEAKNELIAYQVSDGPSEAEASQVLLCPLCIAEADKVEDLDQNHLRCLANSMWSEHQAVQVLTYRLLSKLNNTELLSQMYLDDDALNWANATLKDDSAGSQSKVIDSNGTELVDGDSVTLIKDLDVKGGNFTAKRGTMVKNISLGDDPTHVLGKVSGQQIFLKTCFLKKSN